MLAEISDHRKVVEQVAEQDEKLTQHWQSQVDKFGEIANAMRKTWHLLKSQTAMKQIVFDNPGTGTTLESHLQLPYIIWAPLRQGQDKLNCSLCGSPRVSATRPGPIRRVFGLTTPYYYFSEMYQCNQEGCRHSMMGDSDDVLNQLPNALRAKFPPTKTRELGIMHDLPRLSYPRIHNQLMSKRNSAHA